MGGIILSFLLAVLNYNILLNNTELFKFQMPETQKGEGRSALFYLTKAADRGILGLRPRSNSICISISPGLVKPGKRRVALCNLKLLVFLKG